MVIGRVTEAHRSHYTVTVKGREYLATVRGVFFAASEFPKVGDYVTVELLIDGKAVIEEIQPRTSIIKRRGAEDDEVQIIATNVDVIIIVMGLDGDYNLSRLERYLLLAKQSDIAAIVVLNKKDLVSDLEDKVVQVKELSGTAPVYAVTAKTGDGLLQIAAHITPETTAVLLGSSGAGKSTITNWLLQESRQAISEIRQDDSKGRHTTTSRQLFALPSGGFLIDTPGMRELGVLEQTTSDEEVVFETVQVFAEQCRFKDCDHEKSAGCAVLAAVASGELSERVFHNYKKLCRERLYQQQKDATAATRHTEQHQKRLKQKQEALRCRNLLKNRTL